MVDFDGDGCVGVPDLLALIANFGPCPGSDCPWDIDGYGVVGPEDLQAVNQNLGPCQDPGKCVGVGCWVAQALQP